MSALRRVAARLHQLSLAVPASARDNAKLALLHNLLVAYSARDLVIPGEPRSTGFENAPGLARVLRDGTWVPAQQAVVQNSLLMGARAQHDEHPGSVAHFGSVIIPELLTLADTGALTDGEETAGRRLLDAMVLGYQAGSALASVVGPTSTPKGFRPTGLFGPFSGAAACSIARRATESETVNSLAFALSSASSFTQVWRDGSDEWRFQTAFAARSGFEASEISSDGAIGAAFALEGPSGFLRSFGGVDQEKCAAAVEAILQAVEGEWAIDNLLLKPYPVCAINQAATWRALQIVNEHSITPAQVEEVRVRLSPADAEYPGIDYRDRPASWAQAMMSLPHAIATAIHERTVAFNHLLPPYANNVTELATRIFVLADPSIVGDHAAEVEFRLHDGSILGGGRLATVPRGWSITEDLGNRLQPEHQLSHDELGSLTDSVRNLDHTGGLQTFLSLLAKLSHSPVSKRPERIT